MKSSKWDLPKQKGDFTGCRKMLGTGGEALARALGAPLSMGFGSYFFPQPVQSRRRSFLGMGFSPRRFLFFQTLKQKAQRQPINRR
jgi:hypothetical protein